MMRFRIVEDWARGGKVFAYPITHNPPKNQWREKGIVDAPSARDALEKWDEQTNPQHDFISAEELLAFTGS